METKTESRITEESVIKAIAQGCQSPTAVAKKLGYKSGSSGIIKAILKVVPDLRERLQALNDVDKTGKTDKTDEADNAGEAKVPVKDITANPTSYQIPDCVPYRPSSGYAMVWAILYAHLDKGISRQDLTVKYQAWSEKAEQNCKYDVQVVCSPTKEGGCNRSASKASQSYWVERKNDLLKLHLVGVKG